MLVTSIDKDSGLCSEYEDVSEDHGSCDTKMLKMRTGITAKYNWQHIWTAQFCDDDEDDAEYDEW